MNETLFVDKFYEMNIEDDELLSNGSKLRDGMIVLLEDSLMRGDYGTGRELGPYEMERVRETQRWCEVSEIEIRRRWDQGEFGEVLGEGSPLISFVAIYPDGTKKKRTYDSSYAWLVKKITMEGAG